MSVFNMLPNIVFGIFSMGLLTEVDELVVQYAEGKPWVAPFHKMLFKKI